MNKLQSKLNNRAQGFTIIEVVLVLAIAGLIFLMVFIALPALQRSQRDTQRKDDLSRINTQITNYESSNRGAIPTTGAFTTASTGFVAKYLGGSSATAGNDYVDPSSGNGYTFTTTATDPTTGQINYQTGVLCGTDGAAAATSLSGKAATARSYVLRMKLEGQTAPYCLDDE